MHFLEFTQVCTKICIILTDSPCYKEYILNYKVRYCVCYITMTVEYGLAAIKVWVVHLKKNLVSIFLVWRME